MLIDGALTHGRRDDWKTRACHLTLAVSACTVACARIEPPPGGPIDRQAPRLLAIFPDSMAVVPGFDEDVSFSFNEVVSEGGSPSEGLGTGDLERLVLLSPSENVPVVRWKRDRITVRPKEGWKSNTVYRVELLPGVTDLRTNRASQGGSVTFTTGAPTPDYTLTGKVYDWTTSQPARAVLLEAILQPDSLVYRSTTDSSGTFSFGPLPRGEYLVVAVVDQNRDRKRGGREVFDSIRVKADTGVAGAKVPELWMFQRDSLPPRLQPPTVLDSLSISLPFNQKLDPAQTLDSTMVQVWRLPDTTLVPVVALNTNAAHDSLYRVLAAPQAGAADSAKARADKVPAVKADTAVRARPDTLARLQPDTAGRAQKALDDSARAARPIRPIAPARPPLSDKLSARLAEPLVPGASYTVLVRGVRNASGVVVDSSRAGFKVPERPKPTARDSLRLLQMGIDSAWKAGDTLRVDSLRKLLPDSLQTVPIDSLLQRMGPPPGPSGLQRTPGDSLRKPPNAPPGGPPR
jgi:hypothetical protein